MKNVLISACLLGLPTRYDGKAKSYPNIDGLREKYNLIPFCPEIYGGLSTPRVPAERVADRVMTKDGRDVTEEYKRGAKAALDTALALGCSVAILKEGSPACGSHRIYSGSFDGVKVGGMGVAAELLSKSEIRVISELEIDSFLKENK